MNCARRGSTYSALCAASTGNKLHGLLMILCNAQRNRTHVVHCTTRDAATRTKQVYTDNVIRTVDCAYHRSTILRTTSVRNHSQGCNRGLATCSEDTHIDKCPGKCQLKTRPFSLSHSRPHCSLDQSTSYSRPGLATGSGRRSTSSSRCRSAQNIRWMVQQPLLRLLSEMFMPFRSVPPLVIEYVLGKVREYTICQKTDNSQRALPR